jgi:nucleoside-diphosphate kinase
MLHKERTFVIIKPDGIQRSLVGEIIGRFERVGVKIVGMKFGIADSTKLWQHYNKDEAWYTKKGNGIIENLTAAGKPLTKDAMGYGKGIIEALVTYITSGPVLMLALQGNQAINVVKKLTGGTEPSTSDVGTIRGDFTLDSYQMANMDDRAVRNLIHCSDNADDAVREIALWFDEKELVNYKLFQEQVLYDVTLNGILED